MRTDHSSLLWLRKFKEPEGQLAHWLEQLEEYDFDIVHRQGKLHNNADALLRLPCTDCENDTPANSVISMVANTSLYLFTLLGTFELNNYKIIWLDLF